MRSNPEVDRCGLGEGKLQTYCIAVYPGKESRFIEFMEPRLLTAGPVKDPETGRWW